MPAGCFDRVLDRLADALGRSPGRARERFDLEPRSNGPFHRTFRLRIDSERFFVKQAAGAAADSLAAEADGLTRLAAVGAVSVPAVHAIIGADDDLETALLVLEWLDLGPLHGAAAAQLGEHLAALHRDGIGERHGLDRDNWIGATPQVNAPTADWTTFLFECRIGPMVDRLADAGKRFGSDTLPRLRNTWSAAFADYRPLPSLLHGDLWAGNAGQGADGTPVIFDPAVHYGDRECDLAMASLFGGFDASFFESYEAAWPLDAGWEFRRGFYQLYHVLNHALLFGGGYVEEARQRIAHLLRGRS
ncbi:fructosamine kinase family protein [Halomonas denitrificans]|nr:fructosamine kinase family protein [Halomonas denitrificans]